MIAHYLKTLKQSGIMRKIPNISEENGDFIVKILQEKNPEHILEIGTANGFSSLYFMHWLQKNPQNTNKKTKIFTIEYAWNAHNEAVEHFKNCKMKNIFPIWGDAKEIIDAFQNHFFDIIYIDAMKKEYLEYLILSIPKAKSDALFILDDVEKFAYKMPSLYDFLAENNIDFTLHKTDADDSIMCIERKNIPL